MADLWIGRGHGRVGRPPRRHRPGLRRARRRGPRGHRRRGRRGRGRGGRGVRGLAAGRRRRAGRHLRALADAAEAAAGELVALLTREQGKPTLEAQELRHFLGGLRYYAEAATKVQGSYQELPSQFGPAYGLVVRRPIGVVGAVTPWNFPLTLLGNKLGPALAAGNTVVAKPAETTLTTLRVAELAGEAGLPPGVLNVVTGGPPTGEALVAHPGVRRVAFTGQTATGRRIMELAGPALKPRQPGAGRLRPDHRAGRRRPGRRRQEHPDRPLLELRPGPPGPQRAFVQAGVYDAFVERLAGRVGATSPARVDQGREAAAADRPAAHRRATRAARRPAQGGGRPWRQGGRRRRGGRGPGHFFQPAVVVDVPPDCAWPPRRCSARCRWWRVEDLDEAIERANDTAYGLGLDLDPRRRGHRPGHPRAGGRRHLGQPAPLRLRRAAVRGTTERPRPRARPPGPGGVHRAQAGRRRRLLSDEGERGWR